jgi:fructose-1,6-bisphosphatase
MTIGGAHLKDISYKFYHDQFAGVMLRTPENSSDDEEAIIAAFTVQFGQGYKDNQFLKRYLWRGSVSTVYLDCNSFIHACTGALLSNQLLKLEEADKAAAARKGAKDF